MGRNQRQPGTWNCSVAEISVSHSHQLYLQTLLFFTVFCYLKLASVTQALVRKLSDIKDHKKLNIFPLFTEVLTTSYVAFSEKHWVNLILRKIHCSKKKKKKIFPKKKKKKKKKK